MSDSLGHVHLQRGLAFEEQGDIVAAEREYRLSDDAGSGDGALNLGLLLKRRGDHAGAVAAYRRSEERGDPRASCNLAVLLEQLGDINGAKAAYRRADERGFPGGAYGLGQLLYHEGDLDGSIAANRRADELGDADGAYNLGILHKQRGDRAGAEAAFSRADQRGHTGGTVAFGKLLRDRGDYEGAERALRRAEERGDPDGAFELGALAYDRQDIVGAVAAFERAASLGKDRAAELAGSLRAHFSLPTQPSATNIIDENPNADVESAVKQAHLYAAACQDVVNATNAVIETANNAVGARNMADNLSQHEISRKNFQTVAEQLEQEFVSPYKAFLSACATARDAAAKFRSAAVSHDPELILLTALDDNIYGQVGVATQILRTSFGTTPSAFIEGVKAANAAVQADIFAYGEDGFLGRVYSPPPQVEAAERACPWCAETIKAAARICRFCGRDVEPHSNV